VRHGITSILEHVRRDTKASVYRGMGPRLELGMSPLCDVLRPGSQRVEDSDSAELRKREDRTALRV
jgi:hypothetical protein